RQGQGAHVSRTDHVVQVGRDGDRGSGGRDAGVALAQLDGFDATPIRARTPPVMALIVKICGLSAPDALDVALDAGADMVGFIFFPPSPRNVSLETARALGSRVQERARKVAVTVDADDTLLASIIEALKPDMLQLHGHETPQRVAAVRESFGLPVMQALPIEAKSDLLVTGSYTSVADRLLFDARPPHEATRPGGLGKP